ncbi:MAG TPA: hypothetical protein VI451_08950, partial [Anaerolineales bacterium]|nr:hypothetical protein [Anaerolineales bacterium]
MSESYKNSIARVVKGQNKTPIGAGVLVGARQVLTCAHVVNAALGREDLFNDPPSQDARITLDFPAPAPDVFLTTKIVGW